MDEELEKKYKRLRNLPQFRKMDADSFEEAMLKREQDLSPSSDFEARINLKLKKYDESYDLSDLKINDHESLRALIQAQIALEDYEQILYRTRLSDPTSESIYRLSKVMNDLRSDISAIQTDLKITRKVRKSDQETSLINYIESLKEKAKKFHEAKEKYIFCDKCNLLLATVWTLYPNANNKIKLTCQRTLENGEKCGNVVEVTTKMLDDQLTNKKSILPESLL
jgi:hypothetical protein